ncbi:MAG TPA: molybdenum cofactor guanylyltransferase MobA [Hyphomicrobium sp.]|nr:molybdenum cofactor guanylyltransferase MobA [Hyphomicrobium sp.]HRO51037.1 molybdenum cofactor guanylyltransferase MobA [Hyphomicrobium sp.]
MMQQSIAGVVLAGGMSRRMGGPEKALMVLGGAPLVAHAVARLRPQVASLILNANGDPARFSALGHPVVPDETADRPGPLAGVLAALHWFARHEPEVTAVASLPADSPLVPADLVARLRDGLVDAPHAKVAVASSRDRRHPVIALWKRGAAPEIEAALARGERAAHAMIDRLGAVSVPFADLDVAGGTIDPFFNVNTPEDLAVAEDILSKHREPGASP